MALRWAAARRRLTHSVRRIVRSAMGDLLNAPTNSRAASQGSDVGGGCDTVHHDRPTAAACF